jgi:Bacterial Ig-like domain (group 2)
MNFLLNTVRKSSTDDAGSRLADRTQARSRPIRLWLGIGLVVLALLTLAAWRLRRFPVFSPRLSSITLTPQTTVIPKGLTRQFPAIGTYSDGSVRDLTALVTWNSSDGGVVPTDNTGMVTAVNPGDSIVRVTSGSSQSTLKVSVTPPHVVALAVSPVKRAVGPGSAV